MNRRILSFVVAVTLLLAAAPLMAPAVGPPRATGPVASGRVVAIDTTAQAIQIRTEDVTLTVTTDVNTLIVGIDEGWPSREATIIPFSAIRRGDLVRAYGTPQPDGSLLARTLVINHRDFARTGRVISIDTTAQAFVIRKINPRTHRSFRLTINYTSSTRVVLRGRRVAITRMTIGSLVHVWGYGSNNGLVAKKITILWARRVGQRR